MTVQGDTMSQLVLVVARAFGAASGSAVEKVAAPCPELTGQYRRPGPCPTRNGRTGRDRASIALGDYRVNSGQAEANPSSA